MRRAVLLAKSGWVNSGIGGLALTSAAIFMLAALIAPPSAPAVDGAALVAAVNARRAANGLPELIAEARLAAAARRHAEAMARIGFFAHEGPDGAGLGARLVSVGYPARRAAENIAFGPDDPERIATMWMDSAGHRRNMLLGGVREAGVGHAVRIEEGGLRNYWVLIVAGRLADTVAPLGSKSAR